MKDCTSPAWNNFFQLPAVKGAVQQLIPKIKNAMEPQMPLMFRALDMVAPDEVKVVILGQDPTPQPGKATGLAFSVVNPKTVPTVLNVLLEVALEGWSVNLNNGDLTKWARQGVLLLNTALTVQRIAGSHLLQWAQFSKLLIEYISNNAKPSVWFLWGEKAKLSKGYIGKQHYVITGGHPSTKGAITGDNNFFGVNYFNCANQFLTKTRMVLIDWGLAVAHDSKLAVKNVLNRCPAEPKSIQKVGKVVKKVRKVIKKVGKVIQKPLKQGQKQKIKQKQIQNRKIPFGY